MKGPRQIRGFHAEPASDGRSLVLTFALDDKAKVQLVAGEAVIGLMTGKLDRALYERERAVEAAAAAAAGT